jgi:DNA-binding SARP family transcriptional activator
MEPLRISLLGTPLIEVDGRPLAVDTRKAIAMLAFLAVTDRAHSRAVVADLLWPELDGARGGAALRRTLSTLRTALGEDRLACVQAAPRRRAGRLRAARQRRVR